MELAVAGCDCFYIIGRGQAVHKNIIPDWLVIFGDKFKLFSVLFDLHVASNIKIAFLFFKGAVYLLFTYK